MHIFGGSDNTAVRLSNRDRRDRDERRLKFATNIGLLNAVLLAMIICWVHGGVETASLTAFGGALALGAVLGFLFGVPGESKSVVHYIQAKNVALDTGAGSVARVGPVAGGPEPAPQAAPPAAPQPGPAISAQPAPAAAAALAPQHAESAAQAPQTAQSAAWGSPSSAPAMAASQTAQHGEAPVALQQTPPPNSTDAGSSRSNLEQVADWVTKLLLGGGLTQLQRIPPKIWQWSHAAAMGILGSQPVTEQQILPEQAFACGLMVYGFVLGFFGGFLVTKLQLGKAIVN